MTAGGGASRPPLCVCLSLLLLAVALCAPAAARAGHELPFYPSFYPQEIKIDSMEPAAAAPLVAKSAMQAYVGGDPFAGRKLPADMTTLESLGGFLVVSLNPAAPGLDIAERRCERARRIAGLLVPGPGWVAHPYPVTPYHADYLQHADVMAAIKAPPAVASETTRLRARGALAERAAGKLRVADGPWDATVEEVSLDDLLAPHRGGLNGSLGPVWVKQGWYHAWLLHAQSLTDSGAKQTAAESYRRLTTGAYDGPTESVAVERRLVRALVAGCERVEAGYVLRREVFSAEFSQGIENIVSDSQTGLNTPAFIRTAPPSVAGIATPNSRPARPWRSATPASAGTGIAAPARSRSRSRAAQRYPLPSRRTSPRVRGRVPTGSRSDRRRSFRRSSPLRTRPCSSCRQSRRRPGASAPRKWRHRRARNFSGCGSRRSSEFRACTARP